MTARRSAFQSTNKQRLRTDKQTFACSRDRDADHFFVIDGNRAAIGLRKVSDQESPIAFGTRKPEAIVFAPEILQLFFGHSRRRTAALKTVRLAPPNSAAGFSRSTEL